MTSEFSAFVSYRYKSTTTSKDHAFFFHFIDIIHHLVVRESRIVLNMSRSCRFTIYHIVFDCANNIIKQLKFMSFLLSHSDSHIVKAKHLTYAVGYTASTIEIELELRFSLMLRLHDIQDNIKRENLLKQDVYFVSRCK